MCALPWAVAKQDPYEWTCPGAAGGCKSTAWQKPPRPSNAPLPTTGGEAGQEEEEGGWRGPPLQLQQLHLHQPLQQRRGHQVCWVLLEAAVLAPPT